MGWQLVFRYHRYLIIMFLLQILISSTHVYQIIGYPLPIPDQCLWRHKAIGMLLACVIFVNLCLILIHAIMYEDKLIDTSLCS